MQSQLPVKLTRVPDCWSVVMAAERWFEPGGNDWQLARASARFRGQAALRSALSPGIRRHMMVTVRGHKAQYTEGGGSKLPGQTDCQSTRKQGLHIHSTSRNPLSLPASSFCNFLGGVSPAAPWLHSDSAAVSVSYTKLDLNPPCQLIHRGNFELNLKREFL